MVGSPPENWTTSRAANARRGRRASLLAVLIQLHNRCLRGARFVEQFFHRRNGFNTARSLAAILAVFAGAGIGGLTKLAETHPEFYAAGTVGMTQIVAWFGTFIINLSRIRL